MKQNEHTLEQICADLCNREQIRGSIGLLGEKILHAGLKLYFEPNSDFHGGIGNDPWDFRFCSEQ